VLFGDITQCTVATPYQCFGTTYQSHHQGFLTMGPIGCPKMSVRNYHSMLCNIPEDCRHHIRSSRSQKSHNVLLEQKKIKKI